MPQFLEFPKIESRDALNSASNSANTSSSAAALNFLRNGIAGRGLNSFFPTALDQNNPIFGSNFPFQECKPPGISFPIEGVGGSRYESSNAPHQDSVNGSLMFTLGATRRNSNVNDEGEHQDKGQENSNGFWNGMLGGGSW